MECVTAWALQETGQDEFSVRCLFRSVLLALLLIPVGGGRMQDWAEKGVKLYGRPKDSSTMSFGVKESHQNCFALDRNRQTFFYNPCPTSTSVIRCGLS